MVSSWLAVANRTVADDAGLRFDVHLRPANMRKLHVEMLR